MLIQAIGSILPLALAVALSPFPVIGIVLLLSGGHRGRNGALFAFGWVVALTVLAALVVAMFDGAVDPDSPSSAIADWARVIAGGALIVLGIRKVVTRPRPGDDVEMPAWMASLEHATAARATLLGAALGGANPKNVVLTAAASAVIVEAGLHGTDLIIAIAAYVIVGSCTVVGAVVAHLVGGQRAASLLAGVRQFMLANNNVIVAVVLLLIGANVLGGGLVGLGR